MPNDRFTFAAPAVKSQDSGAVCQLLPLIGTPGMCFPLEEPVGPDQRHSGSACQHSGEETCDEASPGSNGSLSVSRDFQSQPRAS